VKCQHSAHIKCLQDYQLSAETDMRKREIKKIIGLDFDTYQCPLCKHVSNALIPSVSLKNFSSSISNLSSSD